MSPVRPRNFSSPEKVDKDGKWRGKTPTLGFHSATMGHHGSRGISDGWEGKGGGKRRKNREPPLRRLSSRFTTGMAIPSYGNLPRACGHDRFAERLAGPPQITLIICMRNTLISRAVGNKMATKKHCARRRSRYVMQSRGEHSRRRSADVQNSTPQTL